MGPAALAQVLRPIRSMFDPADYPDLLRGLDSPDDALVWKLDAERALVHTADFFPPVVDDPYAFGAIAAANALSDVYAMGGKPIFAINLVGFPDDMDPAILTAILKGGADKVKEAGAVVAGGHTTSDKEPKYGLAVTGIVHPDRVLAKGGANPGDMLVLTKPLGTGIVTTAGKREKVDPVHMDAAIASMMRLSATAARVLGEAHPHVHALTDITGFALVGHAHEMAHLSDLTFRFRWDALPLLPGVKEYALAGLLPGGGRRNAGYYAPFVTLPSTLEPWQSDVLHDPQTSGPLLAAVAPEAADRIVRALREAGEHAWIVGEAIAGRAGGIEIV
ncbi:MAG TPA: selenide, water dikinase SelD [Candidatus Polarisedimenticolaceae bacterium]|nr:selenide, water dikinase SelD [Candidatus Polarisedimenticolaceae bacterium]